jgi:hypothetical protein
MSGLMLNADGQTADSFRLNTATAPCDGGRAVGTRSARHEKCPSILDGDTTMLRLPYWFTLVLVSAITFSSPSAAQDRIEHRGAGVAINRPAGWHDLTLAQVQETREHTRLADPELQHAISRQSAMPILSFTKYQEPHAGLNPTIQLGLRPLVAGAPTEVLEMALQTMPRLFADFRPIAPVEAVQVAGLSAAHATATYTQHTDGGETFPVKSRLWLVPRGRLMFLITMSGSQTGEDVCEREFEAVISTLTIEP